MYYHIICALLLSIAAAQSAFGQDNFRNGYLITLESDTIYGQVNYRSNTKNYMSCIFKDEQEVREFFSDEIIGFGYVNDKYFSSQIVEGVFVEVLVLGEISLYKSQDKYHLKKDSSIHDLETIIEEVLIDGMAGKKENHRWRGVTSYLISDCIENPNNVVSNLKLNEKSLTKVIVNYNKCRGSDFKEFKESKPWIKYELGATVGLARSEIQVTNKALSHLYLDDTYQSFDPSFGILMEMSSPRIGDDFSFQSEIHFIRSRYSSLVVLDWESRTEYHESYIYLSTLSIPLSLKYYLPANKSGLYFQGGINYDYHVSSDSRFLSESVVGNVVNTSPEHSSFDNKNSQLGYWGGIGILRSYQKFKASIAIRYFRMNGLNSSGGFRSTNNRLSLNIILFKI